jgi:hypothetical protein
MGNLVEEIVEKIKTKYGGHFRSEIQRADLWVYIDGEEMAIESICTDTIYFEDDYYDVKLYDADIHTLAYINEVI